MRPEFCVVKITDVSILLIFLLVRVFVKKWYGLCNIFVCNCEVKYGEIMRKLFRELEDKKYEKLTQVGEK